MFAHQTIFTLDLMGLNTPLFREGVEAVEAKMMSRCQIGINVMLLCDKQPVMEHLPFLDSS